MKFSCSGFGTWLELDSPEPQVRRQRSREAPAVPSGGLCPLLTSPPSPAQAISVPSLCS